MAFHDITFSAPKSFSVAAVVGGDERLVEAFHQTVEATLAEMEKVAAVRVRSGAHVRTEATRKTGNLIAGVFHHDSSRALDPQLHAHAVLANASYDEARQSWFALQPVHMLTESSTSLRSFFYHDLAGRAQELGYGIEWRGNEFRLKDVPEKLDLVFSQRTVQRQAFEMRFQTVFKEAPSKRRIEQFIKEGRSAATKRFRAEHMASFGRYPSEQEISEFLRDWRDPKLARISTAEVRRLQRARMQLSDAISLDQTVLRARQSHSEALASGRGGEANPARIEERPALAIEPETVRSRVGELVPTAMRKIAGGLDRLSRLSFREKSRHRVGVDRLAKMSRSEVLRRLRRGRRVAQAMSGLPRGLAAHAIRSQAVRSVRRAG